ncbi:MAG: DUF2993 domain-containing protein [Pseudonocardiales bacterium]|nr:DUF2993 domain-containing protein [Pseudonocardiales bacterium]
MKRIVIAMIIVVALFVALDFAAASAAEYQVSNRIRERLALPSDPDVRITGFPFLFQALSGDYRKVDVYAQKLTVGDLDNVGLHALLYHVRLPFRDVVNGHVTGLTVDEAQGSILITKEDLARKLPGVTKLRVEPVDAADLDQAKQKSGNAAAGSSVSGVDPDQAVRLIATVMVLGRQVEATVIAVLQLTGKEIQVSPRDIRIGSGADATLLPPLVQSELRRMFTLRLDPGTLPFGVTPTMLKAVDKALEISGSARDLVIGEPSTAPNSR